MTIQLDCGEAQVATAAGAGWSVEGTNEDGQPPTIEASSDGLAIRTRERDDGFFQDLVRSTWRVTLPADPTIDLRVSVAGGDGAMSLGGVTLGSTRLEVTAGSRTLDLSGAVADRLEVQVNAGSASVTLPTSDLTGTLTANAGSIEVCAPAGAGLRLTAPTNIFGSNDFSDQGLVQDGDTWETPGYDEADYQIKVRNLIRFLQEGDKAKVTLRFRGREMAHQELGAKLLERVKADLDAYGVVEQFPKMEGRQLIMVLAPTKKPGKGEKEPKPAVAKPA